MAKKKLRIDGFQKALKVSISTLWEHRKIKNFIFLLQNLQILNLETITQKGTDEKC